MTCLLTATGTVAARGFSRALGFHVDFETGPSSTIVAGAILLANRTSPRLTPYLLESVGLVLVDGGILSHAANICRLLGIPCIVGIPPSFINQCHGSLIELDALSGTVKLVFQHIDFHTTQH